VFVGQFVNDIRSNGFGVMTYSSGVVYEGHWVNEERSGVGKITSKGGDVYDGMWRNHLRNGEGVLRNADGSGYSGEWKDGKRHGRGTETDKYGVRTTGEWLDDKLVSFSLQTSSGNSSQISDRRKSTTSAVVVNLAEERSVEPVVKAKRPVVSVSPPLPTPIPEDTNTSSQASLSQVSPPRIARLKVILNDANAEQLTQPKVTAALNNTVTAPSSSSGCTPPAALDQSISQHQSAQSAPTSSSGERRCLLNSGLALGPTNISTQLLTHNNVPLLPANQSHHPDFKRYSYAGRGVFEGVYNEVLKAGRGVMIYSDGGRYEGEWRGDGRHGQGVMRYMGVFAATYTGHWIDDQKDGRGVLTLASGAFVEGEWRKGIQGQVTRCTGSDQERGILDIIANKK
jgi:hypothetical protein